MNLTTKFLLKRNEEKSKEFISPINRLARQYFRSEHPTEIGVGKCMDGRLNFVTIIEDLPQGIVQPYRQIAGVFDLGDPYLGSLIEGWVNYSISKTRKCLFLSTYHFSSGDHHKGCAGHKENTEEALKWAKKLVKQFNLVFGENAQQSIVYPIVVGIDTDTDGLIFHNNGKTFSVFNNINLTEEEINKQITHLYPEMATDVRNDLLFLIYGNYKHVKTILKTGKEFLDLVHGESIICIGRGFGWLHEPNKALIIGPYNNELFSVEDAIETAGNIVLKNIKEGRVSGTDGITVMCSSLFFEEGMNRMRETIKAYTLYKKAKKVLEEKVPELFNYNLEFLVGSTKQDDWLFRQIDPKNFESYLESTDIDLSDEEINAIKSLK